MNLEQDIKKQITNTIYKIVGGRAKPNGVVFCCEQNNGCKYVRYDGLWVVYRSLKPKEKLALSSGLCPSCRYLGKMEGRK